MIRLWYKKIADVVEIFFSYPVSAFAAQTTFFLIISAFPFAMLLISLIGFLPWVETDYLQNELCRLLPDLFDPVINRVFNEIGQGRSLTLISVAALTAWFASSRGLFSLVRGLNMVYGIKDNRNYITARLMAMVFTIGMIVAIGLTLVLMVFGDKIFQLVILLLPDFASAAVIVDIVRILFIFLLLTGTFTVLYKFAPSHRTSLRAQLPGAMLAATGWILFSLLYSIYLNHVNTYIYGSLAAAVFMMLWLYFCIYILFVGAEINQFLQLTKSQ